MKTKTVKISDDQLTLIVDGFEYEAEHSEPFCDDCHLNDNEQCSVGLHQSYCYPHVRKDRRFVIWFAKVPQ